MNAIVAGRRRRRVTQASMNRTDVADRQPSRKFRYGHRTNKPSFPASVYKPPRSLLASLSRTTTIQSTTRSTSSTLRHLARQHDPYPTPLPKVYSGRGLSLDPHPHLTTRFCMVSPSFLSVGLHHLIDYTRSTSPTQ